MVAKDWCLFDSWFFYCLLKTLKVNLTHKKKKKKGQKKKILLHLSEFIIDMKYINK